MSAPASQPVRDPSLPQRIAEALAAVDWDRGEGELPGQLELVDTPALSEPTSTATPG